MIRSNTHFNENLLTRIDNYNKGYGGDNPYEGLILCGEIAKTEITFEIEDSKVRQIYGNFAAIITKSILKPFADNINCRLNTFYFDHDFTTHIFSYVANSGTKCYQINKQINKQINYRLKTGLDALVCVSKKFYELKPLAIKNWLQDQFINLNYLELTKESLISLIDNNKFTKINLSYLKDFTDEDLKKVITVSSKITLFNFDYTAVTEEGIVYAVNNCPHLTKINFINMKITDLSLLALTNCHELVDLSCRWIHVTDEGALPLAENLKLLKKINFAETDISNKAALKFIKNNPDLTSVNFVAAENVNGNEIVDALKNHANLKSLKISNTGTEMTQESFKKIKTYFPNLVRFYAYDFKITFKQFIALPIALPNLEKYYFDLENLTKKQYSSFIDLYPDCHNLDLDYDY